jgi:hypothetical protein
METSAELLAEAMYKAPFVCMAHDKYQEGVTDPAFTYANRAALQLFEGTWDDIIGMPSRKSADEDAQEVGRGRWCGDARGRRAPRLARLTGSLL